MEVLSFWEKPCKEPPQGPAGCPPYRGAAGAQPGWERACGAKRIPCQDKHSHASQHGLQGAKPSLALSAAAARYGARSNASPLALETSLVEQTP